MVLGETMSPGALVEFDVPGSGASSRPSEWMAGRRVAYRRAQHAERGQAGAGGGDDRGGGGRLEHGEREGDRGPPQQGAQRGRDGPLSGLRHHACGLPAPRGFTRRGDGASA